MRCCMTDQQHAAAIVTDQAASVCYTHTFRGTKKATATKKYPRIFFNACIAPDMSHNDQICHNSKTLSTVYLYMRKQYLGKHHIVTRQGTYELYSLDDHCCPCTIMLQEGVHKTRESRSISSWTSELQLTVALRVAVKSAPKGAVNTAQQLITRAAVASTTPCDT